MRRRRVLQWMGGAVAASLAPRLVRAESPHAPPPATWKTAIGLNGFMSSSLDHQQTYPIWEILDFASAQGFDGVELVEGWPMGNYPAASETQRISALRRMYDAFGLQVFSIQLGVADAFDPDPAVRRQWLATLRDRAQFARQVGCDCIGLWPGGGLRGQTLDEGLDRLVESFREVATIAGDLGLLASFELEPPFVFNTEQHMVRILQQVNSPHLKTMFDPSHFDLMSGSQGKPHEMLQRIGVQNIGYVHLTDSDGTLFDGTSRHLPCGDGHLDIPAALATLKAGGFQGWIMIDEWKIADPYEACVKGKQAIERAR